MKRGACSILEGIAQRVADDRCLVGLAALAAVGTTLNVFLRVVPCTAAIVEDQGEKDTGDGPDKEEPSERFVTSWSRL